MKIALLYPRWSSSQDKSITVFSKKAGVYPPLGLAILASYAERLGHTVIIIDGEIENLSTDELVKRTLKLEPDMVGLTASTPFFHVVVEVAEKLKQQETRYMPILIGGPHITIMKEEAFYSCFDFGFIGEAELSFQEFLCHWPQVTNLKGFLFRKRSKIQYNGEAEIIKDLDKLMQPAYHLLEIGKYKMGTLEGTKPFFPIQTTRGCPFKCIFCNVELNTKKVRTRNPAKVVDEIEYIQRTYGINHFIFIDDTFTLNQRRIFELCFDVLLRNLGITFECGTRANLLDESLVMVMSKAGCIRMGFGLESADENVRRIMQKEVPLNSYIEANRWANKYGIETQNATIIGMPGETMNSIKKTMSFLRDNHDIRQANVSIAVPYPGTELYRMALAGSHGLKLIEHDFGKFLRYNNSVMNVGDLTPANLIDLQNQCFSSVYIAPWRWLSIIKKSGLIGFFLTWKRILKCLIRGQWELLFISPSYWRKKC